jgi:hypothetical protein
VEWETGVEDLREREKKKKQVRERKANSYICVCDEQLGKKFYFWNRREGEGDERKERGGGCSLIGRRWR